MRGMGARMYYPSDIVEMAKDYFDGEFEPEAIQKISLYYAKEVGELKGSEKDGSDFESVMRPLLVIDVNVKENGVSHRESRMYDFLTIEDMISVNLDTSIGDVFVERVDGAELVIAKEHYQC